jgi:hypothetical protein
MFFSFPATQRKEPKERSPLPVNKLENVSRFTKQNELVPQAGLRQRFACTLRYPPSADAHYAYPFSLATSYLQKAVIYASAKYRFLIVNS